MHADERSVHCARSHRHLRVLALQCAPEFLDFADGRRKIGIGEQSPLAPGLEHAVFDAVAFAAIARVFEYAHARVPSQLDGAIDGAIVYYHYLSEVPLGRTKIFPYFN